MNYDLLIQNLNKLEYWLESIKGQYLKYPLRLCGCILLSATMIISNIVAVVRSPFAGLFKFSKEQARQISFNKIYNVDDEKL